MTQSAQPAPESLMGSLVDNRYLVKARLARGGMSTVYRAMDTRLDREVALKVLYPHLAEDPTVVHRFEREAKTAARLSHPNVVNVFDQGVGQSPNGPVVYLAMEYVPGFTLRTVLNRQGALDTPTALVYLEAIVRGLAAAHEAGLIHRDVKPENVLVSPEDGRIKVADFGLARAATAHTGTGATLMGTVAYISPELVAGEKADQRSDVYATGIVAFELLTATQPYQAETPVQIALRHVNDRVPAPSTRQPNIPEVMDEFVMHCTEPEPDARPRDAVQMLDMLQEVRSTLEQQGTRSLQVRDVVSGSAAKIQPSRHSSATEAADFRSSSDPQGSSGSQSAPTQEPTYPEPVAFRNVDSPAVSPYPSTEEHSTVPPAVEIFEESDRPEHNSATPGAVSAASITSSSGSHAQQSAAQAHPTVVAFADTQQHQSPEDVGALPAPSPMLKLRGRANTPTHRLTRPNYVRAALMFIGTIMLSAGALLAGWWLGTVLFQNIFPENGATGLMTLWHFTGRF